MPITWYIVPYKTKTRVSSGRLIRYCAIDDYTSEIHGVGGQWTETEILGDRAIVKVRASGAILAELNTVYKRLPRNRLNDSLFNLSANTKQKLKDELTNMGYSVPEIATQFPNDLGTYTLKDVLKFAATKRLKPRYNEQTNEIILDGDEQECRLVESVDEEVQ